MDLYQLYVDKATHDCQIDSHLFQQLFHFSVITASDPSFIIKVLLLTDVVEELEPILVEGVFMFMTSNVLYNDIDRYR